MLEERIFPEMTKCNLHAGHVAAGESRLALELCQQYKPSGGSDRPPNAIRKS